MPAQTPMLIPPNPALSHTLVPTSETISPKTSGTILYSLFLQVQTQDIFFSPNTLIKQQYPSSLSSVQCVCVCACVCACVCVTMCCILHIVVFEPMLTSTLCISCFNCYIDNSLHLGVYDMFVQLQGRCREGALA